MSTFDVARSDSGAIIQPSPTLKIYFAHPVTSYGTQMEIDVLHALGRWMGEELVVNPNSVEHQARYSALSPDVKAFSYWLELARTCNMCVFLPFADGCVGSGVMAEIQTFFDRFKSGARVYEWLPVDKHFRMRDQIYFATPGRALDIEETRARILQLRTKQ